MDGKTNHMIGVKCILVSVDPMLKLIEMPFILQSQKGKYMIMMLALDDYPQEVHFLLHTITTPIATI